MDSKSKMQVEALRYKVVSFNRLGFRVVKTVSRFTTIQNAEKAAGIRARTTGQPVIIQPYYERG